jgi:hypothetical protein
VVQVGTALLRLKSSTFTAGVGNPVLATGELVGSLVLSGLGLLVPLLAAVAVVVVLVVSTRRLVRLLGERSGPKPFSPPP